MAKITAPVKGFKGRVAGVVFEDGKGETDNDNAIAYFRRKGYGIGNTKPTGTGVTARSRDVVPADPRDVATTRVGTPVRDGAVDPEKGDFLGPTNAGQENPHGPDVVNPELHASQGVRPVKGGPVHVDDTAAQDAAETEHTEVSTDGTPVPGSEPVEPPAGNASRDDWAAYVTALGEDPGDRGRDELRDTYGPTA